MSLAGQKALLAERDALLAQLLDLQREHSEEKFWPDANSCLRLSAGHVEGYVAADAVVHAPRTTLAGLLDKASEAALRGGDGNFVCPERLETALAADHAADTPCCVIYSTDTVGGNSGSPVLNAAGEFVAINFDRQRQGLMNEYKWSHAYSRSIGVDVRYILFLVGDYDGCPGLVDEMTRSAGDASKDRQIADLKDQVATLEAAIATKDKLIKQALG